MNGEILFKKDKAFYNWEGKKIKEFEIDVLPPEDYGGKLLSQPCNSNNQHFYDWETLKPTEFNIYEFSTPKKIRGAFVTKREGKGHFYEWDTGKVFKKFPFNVEYPEKFDEKLIVQEKETKALYDWETQDKLIEFSRNKISGEFPRIGNIEGKLIVQEDPRTFYELCWNKKLNLPLNKIRKNKQPIDVERLKKFIPRAIDNFNQYLIKKTEQLVSNDSQRINSLGKME